jgi:hypothetical protein
VECVEYAEAITESEALIADLDCLSKEAPDAKRHAGNFEPAEAVKSVSRPQQRRLQASQDRLRARPQIGSSARRLSPVQMPKFLCGVPRTCQAYREMSSSTHWISEPVPDP